MASQKDIEKTLSEKGIDVSAYQLLIDHGRRKGRLSREEVIDIVPDAEFDAPLVKEFIDAVTEQGITVEEAARARDLSEELGDPLAVQETFPRDEELVSDLADLEMEAGDINLRGVEVDDVLRMYLREASQIPLLTASEEVELARRIERCRRAQEELSHGIVSPQQEKELHQRIEEGRIAREHLIRANTRLVISVAKRYVGRGLPMTDLIQEGNIGLMRAIRNFDYHRGFKFSTYATWWIRQAVSRALADQSRTIRLPAYLSDQMGRLQRVQLDLQQRLGRAPTNEELAEAMVMPVSRIGQMIEAIAQPMSLEAPINEEDESDLGDLLEDMNALDPEEAVSDSMMNEEMRQRLEELPARERSVIELRFGLSHEEPLTLAEVGSRLGITRERARQLEMQAIARLRRSEGGQRKPRGPQKSD